MGGAIFGHGHIVNKDGRGLLADATYQCIKALEQVISDKKCCLSYKALLFQIKKSFTNIDIEKLVTPPGGNIFKQSNKNNIGRGCLMVHLCLIPLKSDQNILDKILECFLLVDKATRFLHKVEILEQV